MSEIRVRIAPSPTGDLHVGTAYIGLFNYCFAKKNNGVFILRVEDTDRLRSRRQYEDRIYEGLQWLGLSYDEGPDVGGPYGPYRQSERGEIYREHCAKLVEAGKAYPCFCSAETLEAIRKETREKGGAGGYDKRCKALSPEDVQRRIAAGDPHVIRLDVPADGECVIQDELFGEVRYPYSQIDDQVLLKSDGMPTYHLANVVDDHLMKISHVIRGEDWLPSTPKHILLYEYFGWTAPTWVHIPLLLNPDRSKMSKRKNPTSVFYYRDAGFLPEALLNYLATIGYRRPGVEDEMFSLSEMISDFDLKNVRLGGSVFDAQKLKWMSGRYIRETLSDDALWARFKEWRLGDAFFRRLMPLIHERLETLGDMMERCHFLFEREVVVDMDDLPPKGRSAEDVVLALQCLLWEFEGQDDWSPEGIRAAIEDVTAFMDWKVRDMTGILFRVMTGGKVGPPLFESMALMGKDMSRERIRSVVEVIGLPGKKKLKKLEESFKNRPAKNEETS